MGLRHRDLENMILPLIGIDKFQPKTGAEKDVIVVSFYLNEEQPAKDLEMFLEMGAIDSLDTDSSPNPDKEGHYVVFVEYQRTKRFWLELRQTIRDIENTSGKLEWIVDVFKHDDLFKLNNPDLVSAVIIDPEEYEIMMNKPEDLETDEFAPVLEQIRLKEFFDFKAYSGPEKVMETFFKLAEQKVVLENNYEQQLINKYTGLDCYRKGNMYLYENGSETIVFKLGE